MLSTQPLAGRTCGCARARVSCRCAVRPRVDPQVDVSPSFTLYMTSRLTGVHDAPPASAGSGSSSGGGGGVGGGGVGGGGGGHGLSPGLLSRVTLVSFTVTPGSLLGSTLEDVLRAERPELAARRTALLAAAGSLSARLTELEASLLRTLGALEGQILEVGGALEGQILEVGGGQPAAHARSLGRINGGGWHEF
jgi:hypothetical protein